MSNVSMAHVLVVGGAGYIGSHMVALLLEKGHRVTTLDDFSTGHCDAVIGGEIVEGSCGDRELLGRLFKKGRFDCVMHFASFIQVGESVVDPAKYYQNNVSDTLVLLDAMVGHGLSAFIFSSSAAVFGQPKYVPIDEAHPQAPINPYGMSKWMIERVLEDYSRAYGVRSVSLRYFNAAGADPQGRIGERHEPETHLIPLILQTASGRRGGVKVFGADYDTPDGTCVRDYIHVVDLCEAHLLAAEYLSRGGPTIQLNLGNGSGFSVRQVIQAAEQVTGRRIALDTAPRRPGDSAKLVADSARARDVLGWQPRFSELHAILDHAWCWEKRLQGTVPS
jgi:UDP-glucose 4-epimerase